MLSKNAEKFVNGLRIKKHRSVEKKYIAEGPKIAEEYLKAGASISVIYATANWIANNKILIDTFPNIEVIECAQFELDRISGLTTPQDVILICNIHEMKPKPPAANEIILVLDNIQDPGNMGTIIRTADWMGITQILCHLGCVDIYNPKVVQATMGSLLRISIAELNAVQYLQDLNLTTYGAYLNGRSVYELKPEKPCAIVIGNEAQGISEDFEPMMHERVTIPGKGKAESLNAAVATGILLSAFLHY